MPCGGLKLLPPMRLPTLRSALAIIALLRSGRLHQPPASTVFFWSPHARCRVDRSGIGAALAARPLHHPASSCTTHAERRLLHLPSSQIDHPPTRNKFHPRRVIDLISCLRAPPHVPAKIIPEFVGLSTDRETGCTCVAPLGRNVTTPWFSPWSHRPTCRHCVTPSGLSFTARGPRRHPEVVLVVAPTCACLLRHLFGRRSAITCGPLHHPEVFPAVNLERVLPLRRPFG